MDLYSITEVSFNVIKRSVRDSLNLLIDNFKQDIINERASGVNVEESELDKSLPRIIERQHEAKLVDEEISTIMSINFLENCENRYCSAFPQAM